MIQRILILSFFLFTVIGKGYSQFIYSPDLQCVVNDNVNGNVTLYWTIPNNACGAFVNYTVYASQNPAGPFSQLAQITTASQTSYVHTNALASSNTWYYYIVTNASCPGATQLSSDTVNNLNPAIPEIVNVDVTPGGDVIMNWQADASPQTHGYVIFYYLPNGNAVPFDTVYGRFTTTCMDINGDPTTQSLVYTVAAFDSCQKFSAFNTNPHNTIYMTGGIASCENQVNMAWNAYHNWPQGVKEYQIWVSTNNGIQTLAGSVDSNTLTYNYTGFTDGDSLCLTVRAVSAADTNVVSNSNLLCLKATVVQIPSYLYMTNATVDMSKHIQITWTIDTIAELIFYKINRSVNNVTFDPADQLSVPSPLLWFQTYIDSGDVLPEKNPYYYSVTAFDSCQHIFESDTVKTVSLQGELYDYYVSHLTWNDFELPYATVIRQNLYRNYGNGYQLIKTFVPGENEYSDSLQQFVNAEGIFCYRIEAVYYLQLPNGFKDTLSSWSNEQCIIHRPIIYIPNAFAPYGVNNVFKPTIIYGDPQGYVMTLFNRWGGEVFTTNDPNTGWDGTDHGKPAQMGGYAYLIQFYANDGVKVERKGIVLLVK